MGSCTSEDVARWVVVSGSIHTLSQLAGGRVDGGHVERTEPGPEGPGSVVVRSRGGPWRPARGHFPAASPQTVSTMTAVTS